MTWDVLITLLGPWSDEKCGSLAFGPSCLLVQTWSSDPPSALFDFILEARSDMTFNVTISSTQLYFEVVG